MNTTSKQFQFKFNAQSYFGVHSPDSDSMRSCIIIEDAPGPYINWIIDIADRFDLRLATVLPFCDESIQLLSGEAVSVGTGPQSPVLEIADPLQTIAIIDMHNDPSLNQRFDGYEPENPELAGQYFWEKVPPSSGIHFLLASRYEPETFANAGLSLNFTQINKSELMASAELPEKTCNLLNDKLATIFKKTDTHARCGIWHQGGTKYKLRFFNEVVHAKGKAVARLYHILKQKEIDNNELCKLSGSPYRKDAVDVGTAPLNSDGRHPNPHEEPSATAAPMSIGDKHEVYKRYKTAKQEHKKLKNEFTATKQDMEQSKQDAQKERNSLEHEKIKISIEAEHFFHEKYGCSFGHGVDITGDLVEYNYSTSEEKQRIEADYDKFQARLEPIERRLLEIGDQLEEKTTELKEQQERLREVGKHRDDLYRMLKGIQGKPKHKGAKPDETIRKDFFDQKSREKRGVYHCLKRDGASEKLMEYLKDNIVDNGGAVHYIGTINWDIG